MSATEDINVQLPLPPPPSEAILKRLGWRLTGECRAPRPCGQEPYEFFCVYIEREPNLFMPWSTMTGVSGNDPVYGDRRWIIEPVEEAEGKGDTDEEEDIGKQG